MPSLTKNRNIEITSNGFITKISDNTHSFLITITSKFKKYSLLDSEITFLLAVCDSLRANNIPATINVIRLSDGTLNVDYGLWQIGRVRLQKKKHSMQVLFITDEPEGFDVEWFDGELNDFLSALPDWIQYLTFIIKRNKELLDF